MSSNPRRLLAAPQRRAALINAAKDAFAERGFAATSMEDVAAVAGVSRLIVYRHFDSKEELYDVVVAETADLLIRALRNSQTEPGGQVAFAALLSVARADPNGFTVLWQHATREPQFAAHADGFRGPAVAFVRTLLTRAGLTGTRLTWAAETLLSFAVDAVTHWVAIEPPERDHELLELMAASMPLMIGAWTNQTR
ncbi:MAG TPA: helix-turn-helix domain-containing protein [Acidimicrobiales bacterium]|nr:helix-turn-helix domain-containing protein [Acidimicrobiales bacterium]